MITTVAHRTSIFAMLGLAGALVSGAHAASLSIAPSRDATLYADPTGQTGNGSGQHLFAGVSGTPAITRSLIHFDVASSIPAGATITSATLTLNMSRSSSGPQDVAIHRMSQSWTEGASDPGSGEGGGDQAQPNDPTWLHRSYNSTFWTQEGGDFDSSARATQSVGDTGSYSWSSEGLRLDVQSWLDQPAGNHGWMLRGNEVDERSAKRFDSRQNLTLANRPVLTVEFTPIPELPAGTSIAGALLGIAVVVRRRHRASLPGSRRPRP